jgi:hypothetical protein
MIPNNLYTPRTQVDITKATELQERILSQIEVVEDALASHVQTSFNYARDNRQTTGVDERIIRALRRRRREYDPEDADLVASSANIYIPIIDLKCRAALSWMTDILANAEEQPWTLDPTANPEIPDNIREVAIQNLKQEITQLGISDMPAIVQEAKKFKALAQEYVVAKAKDATKQMELLIRDQMLEGRWLEEFYKFLDDVSTYPTAIMESPIVRSRERLRWKKNELTTATTLVRESERIDPINVFPSYDSTTTQDGTYIILRKRITYGFLYECLSIPAFKEANIRKLLDKFQDRGTRIDVNTDPEEDELKERNDILANSEYIECLVYYGSIKGQLLTEAGVLVSDPQKPYEAVVWVVDGMTIYAVLNPHPLGVRPLHATSFKKVNGSFWGEALPDILESVERMANAAARALARNMAFASGPFGEVDYARLSAEEADVRNIEPGRLYQVEPSMAGSSETAFRFQSINSHAAELQGITENYMKIADDISGIPAYVLGNPQVAGAGRTMGGLSMLMGNAAKGIKQVIHNVDSDVITPVVTMYYNLEMKYGEDESVKVDAQVHARGSSGILQRELAQTRTVELIQVLTPLVSFIPQEGVQELIRDVLRSRGTDVDKYIPDPRRGSAIASLLGKFQQASQQPNAMPGTPPPPLDGRSMPPTSPDQLSRLPQPVNMPMAGN